MQRGYEIGQPATCNKLYFLWVRNNKYPNQDDFHFEKNNVKIICKKKCKNVKIAKITGAAIFHHMVTSA